MSRIRSSLVLRAFEPAIDPGVYRLPQQGDQYVKVGEDQVLQAMGAGLNEAIVNIPVKAGDLLGIIGAGYTRSDVDDQEMMGLSGDLTTFSWPGGSLVSRLSPHVIFDIKLVDEGSAGVETWEVFEPKPDPVPPRIGIVLGHNVGLVYSDGTDWFKSGPRVPDLDCEAAILVRASDRTVMLGKNIDIPKSAYSTTKLMTSLVTEQYIPDWNSTFVMDINETSDNGRDFFVGDIISYADAVHATLMASDNVMARALGRHVGWVIDPDAATGGAATTAFVNKMNEVAHPDIGMMPDESYSNSWGGGSLCARSQAKLILHMNDAYPKSIAAGGLHSYTMNIGGPNARSYPLTHGGVTSNLATIPEFVSGKTGTGNFLGNLSILCDLDGERYASVVLNSSPNSRIYQDTRKVMDHGYYSRNAFGDVL